MGGDLDTAGRAGLCGPTSRAQGQRGACNACNGNQAENSHAVMLADQMEADRV